jgi:TRAP-type C4-dicarboxylate transport system permease small subunit
MDDTRLGRAVFGLATGIAIAGGVALVIVTIITAASVVGRALIPLGLKPVPGDVEIVQFGVLFAIFCSMPLTQYLRGHADVALLTDAFAPRVAAVIELVMDVVMLAVTAFIVWRFTLGMLDKYGNKEMTFILHVPVWLTYAAAMVGAIGMLLVSLYCVVRSGANAFSSDPYKPEPGLF